MRKSALFVLALCAIMLFVCSCGDTKNSTTPGDGNSRNLPAGTVVYFGSQSPGDAWEVILNADNTFTANNKTTSKSFSGTYSTNTNGTMSFVVTKENGSTITPSVTVYGTLISSTALALLPPGTNNNAIIAYAEGVGTNIDACSTVASDHIGIGIPPTGYVLDSSSPAYFDIKTTAGAPNYQFRLDVYNLDGSLYDTQGEGATFTCSQGVLSSAQKEAYVVIADSGAFVADLGNDGGIAGLQKPATAVSISTILSKSYVATYAHSATKTSQIGGASAGAPPSLAANTVTAQVVATTLTMGSFANPATDAFTAHGTEYVIDFTNATQATPGLIRGATVNGHAAVMVANTANNKLVILGLTTDDGSSDPLLFTLMEK